MKSHESRVLDRKRKVTVKTVADKVTGKDKYMTDTPTIALYYKEHDPMKRKMFLDQSIAAGEDEEANAVRKELWELRYGESSEAGSGTRADGYLALWMAMEYSKDTAGKLFGVKRARKEIEKNRRSCRRPEVYP